jgi:tripartite-type tricarboxylate transporter receptor subunit TctC
MKPGRLKGIAITDNKRMVLFRNTNCFRIFNFCIDWFGLAAPKNTPIKVIETMQKSIARALKIQEVMKTLNEFGLDPVGDRQQSLASLFNKRRIDGRTFLLRAILR